VETFQRATFKRFLARLQTSGAPSTLLAGEKENTLMPNLSPENLALYFILFVVFLFSTTCHEAAHALVAKIGGDETAFLGGQVTLNPVPHIQREPWGMVIIPILMLVLNGSIIGTIRIGNGATRTGRRGWLWRARRRITR